MSSDYVNWLDATQTPFRDDAADDWATQDDCCRLRDVPAAALPFRPGSFFVVYKIQVYSTLRFAPDHFVHLFPLKATTARRGIEVSVDVSPKGRLQSLMGMLLMSSNPSVFFPLLFLLASPYCELNCGCAFRGGRSPRQQLREM